MTNSMDRIIFLVESPFCLRDYQRFGIEILEQNGFRVEVWDFTPFLRPKVYQKVEVPDPINWQGCRIFLSKLEALTAISKLKKRSFIVCLVGYNLNSYPVYKSLAKNKLGYCVFRGNALPPTPHSKNRIRPFFNKLKRITPIKLFNKIKNSTSLKLTNIIFSWIPSNYLGIQPATMVLAGGEKSINNHRYPVSKKTKILWLHTLDYDIYMKEKGRPVQVDKNLVVFLDEYLPFHPDCLHAEISPFATPEVYYPLLDKFFDLLENTYGVRVVIAAHPRSHYEKHPDYFGERPIIRGKTAELIRKSGFVITHSSTAINFSVLYKKPLVFITTNQLQQSPQGSFINLMASLFVKKAINLNSPFTLNWEKDLSVNEEAYRNYKNLYIKKGGTEELPFWQIFADHIKTLT